MDVTFTNVLEGARQYFQGLPAGTGTSTGSTASPAYSTNGQQQQIHQHHLQQQQPHQHGQLQSIESHHHLQHQVQHNNGPGEQKIEIPTSSSASATASNVYWPQQQIQEIHRPPTREHTPVNVQRPSSHHSDSSRPPSHSQQSQVVYSAPQEQQSRIQSHVAYQSSYQDQAPHQNYQFPRPQSREIPQQQTYQQQHIIPSSSYHQAVTPQQPIRTPRHEPMSSSSQSYHQLQNYQNYQQQPTRSYYPVQDKTHTVAVSNSYKTVAPSSQPQQVQYPVNSQNNTYYKYTPQSQSSSHLPQSQSKTSLPNTVQHENKHSSLVPNSVASQGYRATHNLPPIAALSSVNFHSNRSNRDIQRTISRSRTVSASSSGSGSLPTSSVPSSVITNSFSQNNRAIPASSSGHQVITPMSTPSYQNTQEYRNTAAYTNHRPAASSSQNYQYVTTTTQSYSRVIMTTSTDSYSSSSQSHSSSNNTPYYHSTKPIMHEMQRNQLVNSLPQQQRNQQLPQQQQLLQHQHQQQQQQQQQQQHIPRVDLTIDNPPVQQHQQSTSVIKQKVDSPLDLTVKTVRTPADSTHEESDQNRQVYYNSRPPHHNYPTHDLQAIRRNLTQRSSQLPVATAPKVDFSPNFSLSQINPNQSRSNSVRPSAPEKNHRLYEKTHNYPQLNTAGYPVSNVPSSANVISYIQAQTQPVKRPDLLHHDSLNRNSHKPTSVLYPTPTEFQKKRPADTAPSIIPNKVTKVEPWRETINQQIEQKLLDYKQQQKDQEYTPAIKSSIVNGYQQLSHDQQQKEMYEATYQRPEYHGISPHQHYTNTNQYHSQNNLNQTYVPSVAENQQQYPGYSAYTGQQQSYINHQPRNNITNQNIIPNKNNGAGAANKRVISLLRNSLEIKGAKEAQKKLEQEQLAHKNYEQFHHRSDIQHPSTDVTAPLQPKPGLIGRQNISPFTPTNLPEVHSNTTPIHKLHLPKAVDSIKYDIETTKFNGPNVMKIEDKHKMDEIPTMYTNSNSANNNDSLDGLAAFLAARIRTKAELKQVGTFNNNTSNNSQLHNIIENQLKTPIKQEVIPPTTSSSSTSPPKLVKERQFYSPRRRLFSRTEDDQNSNTSSKVPPRDKSGLRSSSETSVFDFPDTDSEGEMPVLERQSLEDMRRDRKTYPKSTVLGLDIDNNIEIKVENEIILPPSPGDNDFDLACSSFVEQLKAGIGKKRGRRKKIVDTEVLAKLESVTEENPLDEVTIKIEQEDEYETVVEAETTDENIEIKISDDIVKKEPEIEAILPEIVPTLEKTETNNNKDVVVEDSDSDVPLIQHKNKITTDKNILKFAECKELTVKLTECATVKEKLKEISANLAKIDSENIDTSTIKTEGDTDKKDEKSEKKSAETSPSKSKKDAKVPIVVRPTKKPAFGDGTDFCPGWEEEVFKYKKSLRIPPSLIQVTRPPQYHRLSTSLPDLDPCPCSPAENPEFQKNKLPKMKSEPIDSDAESNSSFNLFSNSNKNYDSEGGSSIKSLPNTTTKETSSILDKLLERYVGKQRKKYKKKDSTAAKIIPKAENPIQLLPTPSLEIEKKKESKTIEPVIKGESSLLGFRKKTVDNFKDAFITRAKSMMGVNEHLKTVVLKSRTRKETRVMKQRATIKEVFGEDRPASAPPVTCVDSIKLKEEVEETINAKITKPVEENYENKDDNKSSEVKELLIKTQLLKRGRKRGNNVIKPLTDKKIKSEVLEEIDDIEDGEEIRPPVVEGNIDNEEIIIKRDPDSKSETPSIEGDEGSISGKKRNKFRKKFSSGFDYIRKKKKIIKKEPSENDTAIIKPKRRGLLPKSTPESVEDIQKEIKTWVLNKGIGETHLHRASRLGYTDITIYCLEKMDCPPSPKDNAGYTPLHEACARGHLDIAQLLLAYGANASESAQGGIRPLHEAVENGFVEIVRLLLSYGADPMLATYSGLTPLSLATDETTRELIKAFMAERNGESTMPWVLPGPAACFDTKGLGYNILEETPISDNPSEEDDIEFEIAETLLPNLYTLRGESSTDRWILLQDLSNILKVKSRDALLRQISSSASPSTSSSAVNKNIIRELKMSDFLEQAHCCQFLNAGEKINIRASKIALVKYTDRVKELLNVEEDVITVR